MVSGIITADERLKKSAGVKMCIAGPHGIGKTSLAWTLPEPTTLFTNIEAGMTALDGWLGDHLNIRDWETARDYACWFGGPNPAKRPDDPYSQAHFDYVSKEFGDREEALAKYENIFWDSISEMGRLAFYWCKGQPAALSEKTGKPDNRGAYGMLKHEMLELIRHLQHIPDKNIIIVGGLDQVKDDFGRSTWQLQVEGNGTKLELPGIVDEVISMVDLKTADGTPYRAFVCQTLNEWGYPAKDRSGRLDVIEEPHLGKLIDKINGAARNTDMVTTLPAPEPVETESEGVNAQ